MREVLLCSPVLEVRCWRFAEYLDASDLTAPPPLIEPSKVLSQACRLATHIPRPRTAAPRAPDSLHSDMNMAMEVEEVDAEDDAVDAARVSEDDKIWITIGLTKVCLVSDAEKEPAHHVCMLRMLHSRLKTIFSRKSCASNYAHFITDT